MNSVPKSPNHDFLTKSNKTKHRDSKILEKNNKRTQTKTDKSSNRNIKGKQEIWEAEWACDLCFSGPLRNIPCLVSIDRLSIVA
ncbi:hypothetical protein LINGRAHAP2_LOCUS32088 [Linum grandiflorum]